MQSTPHMQQLAKQTRYHKIILICKTIAGVNNNDNQTGFVRWKCNFNSQRPQEAQAATATATAVPSSELQLQLQSVILHVVDVAPHNYKQLAGRRCACVISTFPSDNTIKCHDMPHAQWGPCRRRPTRRDHLYLFSTCPKLWPLSWLFPDRTVSQLCGSSLCSLAVSGLAAFCAFLPQINVSGCN